MNQTLRRCAIQFSLFTGCGLLTSSGDTVSGTVLEVIDQVPADGPATVRVRTRSGELDLVLPAGFVVVAGPA